MTENVKSVFDSECAGLDLGLSLANSIRKYFTNYINKNEDHINFFGGNLLGVHTVRFRDDDEARWFEEVLKVDWVVLEDRLHALPTINKEWKVSSDVFNLSCVWLMHAIMNSPKLSDDLKLESATYVGMMLQIHFLTTRLYRMFRFKAKKETAEAAFAQLSGKYSIKRLGSWYRVYEERALDILSSKSIHAKTIQRMDNDQRVIYLLSDTRTRVADMLKGIFDIQDQMRREGAGIVTKTSSVEYDGEEVLRESTGGPAAFVRYLQRIVTDRHALIKDDLVGVIVNANPTMSPSLMTTTLEWLSDNYGRTRGRDLEQLLSGLMVHALDYIRANRKEIRGETDLVAIIAKLKGTYMSARTQDEVLIEMRRSFEELVTLATRNKNPNTIGPVRTGVMLYLVTRTLTMKHYSQSGAIK